jgi:hypothetical protein
MIWWLASLISLSTFAQDACLPKSAIKAFEQKSLKTTIPYVKKNPDPPDVPHSSYLNIGMALIDAGMMKQQFLGKTPKEAQERLKSQGFVNLLDCPEWKKKIGKGTGRGTPIGAIMIFESKNKKDKLGSIRMRSPAGCIVAGKHNGACKKAGVILSGVYIKNLNQ